MTGTPTSYRLRSGTRHNVTAPLALLAGQAMEAARAGREVLISDPDGNTVAIVTNRPSGLAVIPVGAIPLFPDTDHATPPVWATRLAGLINTIQGEQQ